MYGYAGRCALSWAWVTLVLHPGRPFAEHARDAQLWADTISGYQRRAGVASLADAFDILIHIRQATPVRWLP